MKHSLALVSYLNTKPYIDGLNHVFSSDELDLKLLPPSDCPKELFSGRSDMALIPVGSLLDFDNLAILKDHCIGAEGAVDSVYLFSRVPVNKVEKVLLDPHSRTSNGLTRILMHKFWSQEVVFQLPETRNFELIQETTAGVAIGDVAYRIKDQFQYVYDLSEEWQSYTQLPFVFAVWAYTEGSWTEKDLERIHLALEWGRTHRRQAAVKWGAEFGYSDKEAQIYLCDSIKYKLDAPKHKALERYIRELKELKELS